MQARAIMFFFTQQCLGSKQHGSLLCRYWSMHQVSETLKRCNRGPHCFIVHDRKTFAWNISGMRKTSKKWGIWTLKHEGRCNKYFKNITEKVRILINCGIQYKAKLWSSTSYITHDSTATVLVSVSSASESIMQRYFLAGPIYRPFFGRDGLRGACWHALNVRKYVTQQEANLQMFMNFFCSIASDVSVAWPVNQKRCWRCDCKCKISCHFQEEFCSSVSQARRFNLQVLDKSGPSWSAR